MENMLKQLRNELLSDLNKRGLTNAIYIDKAEEYITLWQLFQTLKADPMTALDNKAIAQMLNISKQMLAIWTALGFRDTVKKAALQVVENDEL